MKCDELKLFSYLEGTSSDQERNEIEKHLKGCKKCCEQLEQLKFTIETFTQFYACQSNGSCPGGEELISFKYGTMDEDRARHVKRHIDQCADCQEELRLLECFQKEEHTIWHESVEAPALSEEILARIEQLKKDSVRDRMGKVLKSLLAMGKGPITAVKIPELLDQYFARAPHPSPAYAIPSDATFSDTELTLREFSLLTDVTLDVGKYRICLKSSGGSLRVSIEREGKAVSDVEVRVKTKSFGVLRGRTGTDGTCVIEGVPPGSCHLKICMPGEKKQ